MNENTINYIISLCNDNQGFLDALLFITALVIGWISGIFRYIDKKPKFKINIIKTYGCSIKLKETYMNFPTYKTAFAIYVEIINIGNAPSSIELISLGYFINNKIYSKRRWIDETTLKSDFMLKFSDSDSVKCLPFIKQRNQYLSTDGNTYLEIGKSITGIIYFEEETCYGSWTPKLNNDSKSTKLIINIKDINNKNHRKKFIAEFSDLNYLQSICPYFGKTYNEKIFENL